MPRVNLIQQWNQAFLGENTPDLDMYVYLVSQVTNTLVVNINQTLTKTEVQDLIDMGMTVEIA